MTTYTLYVIDSEYNNTYLECHNNIMLIGSISNNDDDNNRARNEVNINNN